ncbi:MAG: PqqD family peptide modification chaperone [Bryobacteraceae bacterium]|jgi:hypothetical protein
MKIVAASGQVACETGGETLILNPSNNSYYSLGGVGVRIWQLISRPRTVVEIREALVAEYDVDPAECEAQSRELIGWLAAEQLVRYCE